jgi:hypothetical protein
MPRSEISDKVFFNPHGLERDEVFTGGDISNFLWCLHCERTYQRGKYRLVDGCQMCPYPGCDGDTVIDARDWADVCDENPNYSEFPDEGVRYPA